MKSGSLEDNPDLPRQIREAWAAGRADAALAAIVDELREEDSLLAEALAADAEERWERGRSATLESYLTLVPDLRRRPEACRSLLLCELAWREDRDDPAVAERLKARLPDLGDEIDVVVGFFRSFGSSASPEAAHTERCVGERLGRYELRESLGRGSFGQVWRAWDTALERYIALKLLPMPGDGSADAVLDEARAAAALDHPNIVRVHDAGRLPQAGLLYIDTQLVADPAPDDPASVSVGRPLEESAVGAGGEPLPPRRAAAVMETVCRAVAAAHARGVTHGDIKPGNILVTPSGVPMVADFGLAVVAPAGEGSRDSPTHSVCIESEGGRITGTPAYMSPEQASAERPTPLSDVYSLGATLAALLTGRAPFHPREGSPSPARDVIAQVRDGALDLGAVEAIDATLAAICRTATRREPGERYLSASQLADDLRAWADRRPTRARPLGATGKLALWTRRHARIAAPVGAGVLLLAALSAWYVVSLERAEALARGEAAKYGAVSEFLTSMLASSDPSRAQGREITLRETLDAAGAALRDDPPDSAEVALALNGVIGGTYMSLSLFDEAEWHLIEALLLARSLRRGDHPDTALALQRLARLRGFQGRGVEAVATLDEALAMRERLHGRESAEYADAQHERAGHLLTMGRFAEAAPALEHAYATLRAVLPPDDERRVAAANSYAGLLVAMEKPEEAERVFGEAAADMERTLGRRHARTLVARTNLAIMLGRLGRLSEAEAAFGAILADCEEVMGSSHVITINAMNSLARVLERDGRHAEAEPVFREAMALAEKHLAPTSAQSLDLQNNLAQNLRALGRPAEAVPLFRRSYANHARAYGEDGVFTAMARGGLAMGLIDLHEPDADREAEELLVRSLESLRAGLPPGHPAIATTLRSLATLYGPERLNQPEKLREVEAGLRPGG